MGGEKERGRGERGVEVAASFFEDAVGAALHGWTGGEKGGKKKGKKKRGKPWTLSLAFVGERGGGEKRASLLPSSPIHHMVRIRGKGGGGKGVCAR